MPQLVTVSGCKLHEQGTVVLEGTTFCTTNAVKICCLYGLTLLRVLV